MRKNPADERGEGTLPELTEFRTLPQPRKAVSPEAPKCLARVPLGEPSPRTGGLSEPTGSSAQTEKPPNGVTPPGLGLLEILRRSTEFLARARSASPRLDAELLLAMVLGVSRLALYLEFDRPLTQAELERFRPLLRRRADGVPMGYILGFREFYGFRLNLALGVLVPRPETELLVRLALDRLDAGARRCADLGSGSGCVGLALARLNSQLAVDSVDLAPQAAHQTAQNAARLGVAQRCAVFCGFWASPLADSGPYDLIVSNPPYVTTSEWEALEPTVRDHEPRLALDGGPDGLSSYRELLPTLPPIVRSGTVLVMEGDPRRLPEVADLCTQQWPAGRPELHQDLSGRERVIVFEVP